MEHATGYLVKKMQTNKQQQKKILPYIQLTTASKNTIGKGQDQS